MLSGRGSCAGCWHGAWIAPAGGPARLPPSRHLAPQDERRSPLAAPTSTDVPSLELVRASPSPALAASARRRRWSPRRWRWFSASPRCGARAGGECAARGSEQPQNRVEGVSPAQRRRWLAPATCAWAGAGKRRRWDDLAFTPALPCTLMQAKQLDARHRVEPARCRRPSSSSPPHPPDPLARSRANRSARSSASR